MHLSAPELRIENSLWLSKAGNILHLISPARICLSNSHRERDRRRNPLAEPSPHVPMHVASRRPKLEAWLLSSARDIIVMALPWWPEGEVLRFVGHALWRQQGGQGWRLESQRARIVETTANTSTCWLRWLNQESESLRGIGTHIPDWHSDILSVDPW